GRALSYGPDGSSQFAYRPLRRFAVDQIGSLAVRARLEDRIKVVKSRDFRKEGMNLRSWKSKQTTGIGAAVPRRVSRPLILLGVAGTAFVLCSAVAPASASAAPVLDQQQPLIDFSIGGLAIGGGSQQALAQTVTAGIAGVLSEVQVPASCDPGSDLLVRIEGVSAGTPDGTVLASQLVPGSALQGGGTFNAIDFSNPA